MHVWVFGPGDAIVRHPPLASRARALSPDGAVALLVEGSEIRLQRARDSQLVRLVMLRLASGEVVTAAEAPSGLYSGFPSSRRLRRGGILGGQLIDAELERRCFERSDLVAALFNDEPIASSPDCAALVP